MAFCSVSHNILLLLDPAYLLEFASKAPKENWLLFWYVVTLHEHATPLLLLLRHIHYNPGQMWIQHAFKYSTKILPCCLQFCCRGTWTLQTDRNNIAECKDRVQRPSYKIACRFPTSDLSLITGLPYIFFFPVPRECKTHLDGESGLCFLIAELPPDKSKQGEPCFAGPLGQLSLPEAEYWEVQ